MAHINCDGDQVEFPTHLVLIGHYFMTRCIELRRKLFKDKINSQTFLCRIVTQKVLFLDVFNEKLR